MSNTFNKRGDNITVPRSGLLLEEGISEKNERLRYSSQYQMVDVTANYNN